MRPITPAVERCRNARLVTNIPSHGGSRQTWLPHGDFTAARVFSSKAAGVEDDLTTLTVVAKAEATELEAILAALCGRYPSEFQDIMLRASVIRIGVKSGGIPPLWLIIHR